MKFKKDSGSNGYPVGLTMTKLNGHENQGFTHDERSTPLSQNGHKYPMGNTATNGNNINNSNNSYSNGHIAIISGANTKDSDVTTALPSTIINGSTFAFPGNDKLSHDHLTAFTKPDLYLNSSKPNGVGGPPPPPSPQPSSETKVETTPSNNDVKLKRSLNIWYCIAMMVAVTGHSSIFISPSQIIATSGSLGSALVIWLVAGLINLGTALCFAELGTMYPTAGGPYSLAMKSFGPVVGFLLLWGYAILICGPFWAFLSYTAALYIVRPIFPDCLPDDIVTAIKLLAGWIMVSMVVINCLFMKYVTRFQTLLSGSKVVALAILIAAGIYNIVKGETDNFEDMFEGTTEEPGKMALAFFYAVFSYGGWQVMTTMLEEMKNPTRDAPLSIYVSFFIVIVKYIGANVAYATLMSPKDIISSPAIALDFTDRMYSPLVAVISALVALTCIGALNASIMGHSRLLFGGARSGQLPQIFEMVHIKYRTPWPAIFVFTVMAMVMLFSGGVTDMMEFISLFATIMNLVVIFCLLHLRYTKPDQPRPYKPWLAVPVVAVIINIAVLVLAIYQKPHKMGIGLAILFSGIPVCLMGRYWNGHPQSDVIKTIDTLTYKAQMLLTVTKTKQS